MLETETVSGVFNLGTGKARTFLDLAKATFSAAGKPAVISYIDTPEVIRDKYQYFTEAKMDRLRAAGYSQPFWSMEAAVADYVQTYLSQEDPYV
jgi:ADP-L-glycero-D-manno-heptose 6-epimerase